MHPAVGTMNNTNSLTISYLFYIDFQPEVYQLLAALFLKFISFKRDMISFLFLIKFSTTMYEKLNYDFWDELIQEF